MTTLILPVKDEFFWAIKNGTKQEEFRLRKPFWRRRLEGKTFDRIVLTLGYPAANDHERRIERAWRGMRETTITHRHFGPEPVEVYAIDVSQPFEGRKPCA
ncbi:RNA-binding protein [Paracidovorax avenae]|uniref:RNA-binding protein n=1 Tax=Paracidovorax avenae TaxID=80867 RepID=UPI000D228082|nr:RNA-binding protein [Paracidovorax avenae]AVS68163.1 RNA-binding protein [Paracidovorax avenae]